MLLLRVFTACLFFWQIALTGGDASCEGCNDKLSRELEKTNKDLSRCRANHLAIETRESVFKENAASCEEKRKSAEQMSTGLSTKLEDALKKLSRDQENFQIERDALLQTVASLKKDQKELRQKYDTAIQEHRTATETQQIRHAQQLELVMSHNTQLETQLEEATDAQTSLQEVNTQLQTDIEALNQQKVEALGDAEQWKSKFSQDHSSCEVSLSALQTKLEAANKAHADQLAMSQSSCESQIATSDEQIKLRQEELQSIIDQLRDSHSQETRSLKESCEVKISNQETACQSQVAELEGHNQQLEATMNSTLVELKQDCNKHSEELEKTMRAEVDQALNQGIEIGKNKTSTGIRRLKLLNSKLQDSQRSLMDQTETEASRLIKVKEELFEVRRELFLANEKLREPTIRHRTRMKRIRAVLDSIIKLISPFHHAYVMPLWVPVYRQLIKAIAYFQREHLPGIQSKAAIAMTASQDAFKQFYEGTLHVCYSIMSIKLETVLNATARERQLASDSFASVRRAVYDETILPFYQATLKPAIDTHWLPIYRTHIAPAWKRIVDEVSPQLATLSEKLRFGIHSHGVIQDAVAKKLFGVADVVSDYGHVQKYSVLAQFSALVRDYSTEIVRAFEGIIVGGVVITVLMFMLRRRRRPQKSIE